MTAWFLKVFHSALQPLIIVPWPVNPVIQIKLGIFPVDLICCFGTAAATHLFA